MPNEKLRKSIKNLRDEIDRIDSSNVAAKEKMNQLLGELEDRLDHPEQSEDSQKLMDKLEGMIAEYEVKHPRLAEAMEEILVTLSNMGI